MKKSKKIIISVISIFCTIAIISTVLATMVQLPDTDQELNDFLRSVYMKNFDEVDLSEKGQLKRVINNKNPLHLLNYYAQEPVEELWKSIPEDIKPYTVMLIIISEKAEGSENYIKKIEEVADRCEELKIPYAISNVCGETHFEIDCPYLIWKKDLQNVTNIFMDLTEQSYITQFSGEENLNQTTANI